MPKNIKEERKLWSKILPRPISSEILKERLVKEVESSRPQIEKALGHPLDLKIEARNFRRLNKGKYCSYSGMPEGNEDDIWIRDFVYKSPYWGELPFYIEVTTNHDDSEVRLIRFLKKS